MNIRHAFAAVLAATLLFLTSCSDRLSEPVSRTAALLGTSCSVTLYDRAPEGIFEKVFDRIGRIDREMTLNGETSEIIAVNNAAGVSAVRVSPETFKVISTGLKYAELSGGGFDITVGPLVKLWGIGTDNAYLPTGEEIREKLALIDYGNVTLDESTLEVKLEKPGMMIDLGAIAKGYAGDEAARILRENGVNQAIIDLGGNIVLVGNKPDGVPWKVGVQNPEDIRGSYVGILESKENAVVTSGVYERVFENNGKRYHHILDTATGYPADNGLTSVTIVTGSSMDADALSTSTFVLGLEKGFELVESREGVEAVFITSDRKIYVTKGLGDSFRITNPDFTLDRLPGK